MQACNWEQVEAALFLNNDQGKRLHDSCGNYGNVNLLITSNVPFVMGK